MTHASSLTRHARRAFAAGLLSTSLLAPRAALSQDADWRTVRQDQTWLAFAYDQPLAQRWSTLGDFQWRRTNGLSDPQQFMARTSVLYRVAPGFRVGAGLNYGASAPYGELPAALPSRDRQVFLLSQINHRQGGTDFMHRFRFENRWLADVATNADGDTELVNERFARRARYVMRMMRPLPALEFRGLPVLGLIQNEIFVGLGGNERGVSMDQNRLAFGPAIQWNRTKRLDVLWMQQWVAVPRARANENNRTLWLVLNHTGLPR